MVFILSQDSCNFFFLHFNAPLYTLTSYTLKHINSPLGDTKSHKQFKIHLAALSVYLCVFSYVAPPPSFLLLYSLSSILASFSAPSLYHVIPRSISPPADPPLSHQHPGADECVASY